MNEKMLPNDAINNVSTKRKLSGVTPLQNQFEISLKIIIEHKDANTENAKKKQKQNILLFQLN